MLNPFEALIQKQLTHFQRGLEQAFNELSEAILEGRAGDGLVVVRVTGLGSVVEVCVAEELVSEGCSERIGMLVTAAANEALEKARDLKHEKIAQYTPLGALGIDVPDVI
ncbi:MAG: YbaB/EbfC family nucleoid-associated protein [Armatimonadota bacterium]